MIVGAGAVLHFGTHGALEFMPGKQRGFRLVLAGPHDRRSAEPLYLYARTNPSEGTSQSGGRRRH